MISQVGASSCAKLVFMIDLNALTDPQFTADLAFAGKQYAAARVGELLAERPELTAAELHQVLVEEAKQSEMTSHSRRERV